MKLKIYGTAAAEGIPAFFCSCPVCENARKAGGREIRRRHMSTVDEDIQLDIGPDYYEQIHTLGMDPRKIRSLVLTHSHSDHLMPWPLRMRRFPYNLTTEKQQPVQVFCSREVAEVFCAKMKTDDLKPFQLEIRTMNPYERLAVDAGTALTAVPANHALGEGGAFLYILERDGRCLFYVHDTGPLGEEVYEFLAGREMDGITLDCTGVYTGAGAQHHTLKDCDETIDHLRKIRALSADAKVIINHFSHGGEATHRQLEAEASSRGWMAAWDGMEVEI